MLYNNRIVGAYNRGSNTGHTPFPEESGHPVHDNLSHLEFPGMQTLQGLLTISETPELISVIYLCCFFECNMVSSL